MVFDKWYLIKGIRIMVFDKVYLIKSISAVTNYNSSSCFFHFDHWKLINSIIQKIGARRF